MDELTISGKRFISSRRVAKENGYHTDYVGQLIRSGKLVGQKVGRAWYVESNSLNAFLGKESVLEEEIAAAPEVESENVAEAAAEPVAPVVIAANEAEEVVEEAITEPEAVVATVDIENDVADESKVVVEETPIVLTKIEESSDEAETVEEVPAEERIVPVTIASVKKQAGLTHAKEAFIPTLQKQEPRIIYAKELMRTNSGARVFGRALALAALGVFAFLCAGAASFAFDYRIAVEGSQMSASVSLIEPRQ